VDELIAKISKVPFAQRILVVAVVIVLIGVVNYLAFVSPAEDDLVLLQRQVTTLDQQLLQKRAIAQNLARYRVEVERLKQRLNEALTLLPNDAEIPELLQKIAALVEQSDCEMSTFEPQGEQVAGFYARIPVKMAIVGNYHSIAVFFDKVSKLARIVNVTNINLSEPATENSKVVLKATFLATTFKFVEKAKTPAGASPTGTGFKPGQK
jgi:type IV pilus assembly protein PilO